MFQQNGWRTRGSASAMERVVYLKHTIPPSRSRFSLSSPSSSTHILAARAEATARGRGRKGESNGGGRVRRVSGGVEREDGEREKATLGNQPPPSATPFSFSFRVVYRGMEDGKNRQRYAN